VAHEKGRPPGESRPFVHRYSTLPERRNLRLGCTFPATIGKGGGRLYLPSPDKGSDAGTLPGSWSIILAVGYNNPLDRVPGQKVLISFISTSLTHDVPSPLDNSNPIVSPLLNARTHPHLLHPACLKVLMALTSIPTGS
jgi:hypothetical protein